MAVRVVGQGYVGLPLVAGFPPDEVLLPVGQGGLTNDAVLLWLAPLDVPASALPGLMACLSPEERRRAAGFARLIDGRRFVACRGWLRHLLASQLCRAPAEIKMITAEFGKPKLAGTDLSFSAARSASVALYAMSWEMEVGVDIETIRDTINVDGMAARFMSPAERRALAALPPSHRRAAFFDCWTRKEAYGKGLGTGLGFPLRDVDVWAGDRRPANASGWAVHQVDVGPGWAAAVAGDKVGSWVPRKAGQLVSSSLETQTHPCRAARSRRRALDEVTLW